MANTPQETTQVKNALHLISIKYQEYIVHYPNLTALMTKTDVVVKFMDATPFATNLSLSARPKAGCTTNGFTDHLTMPPTIYINRSSATPATIIYELLHYLTHSAFEKAFNARIVEGTTEYFTRKTQGRATAKLAMFQSSHAGIYDEELDEVKVARGFAKQGSPTERGVMKRAYFRGRSARDPDARGHRRACLMRSCDLGLLGEAGSEAGRRPRCAYCWQD
jgi:hypothetical protein